MAKIRVNFCLKGSIKIDDIDLDDATIARLVDDGPYTEEDLAAIIGDEHFDSHALVEAIDDSEFEVDEMS